MIKHSTNPVRSKSNWKKRALLGGSALLSSVICFSMGALAQETADQPEEQTSTESLKLDSVTVTARFRSESVQDIGAGITALGGDDLATEGIEGFDEIARRVAGLELIDRGPNQNDVSIRGVSNSASAFLADLSGGQGPLVSQFIDEIPIAAASASQRDFNYFDFDRVEVLRGPQPTLFGEGSVGGTIRYFSRDPDLSAEGIDDVVLNAGVSFTDGGDSANYSFNAAGSVVLVPEKLGVRGVFTFVDDAGFIDNPLIGEKNVNDFDTYSGRIVALYEPTDRLAVRLSAFFGSDDIASGNRVDVTVPNANQPSPLFPTGQQITDPDALVFNDPVDMFSTDDFEIYSGKVTYEFDNLDFTSITGYYARERDVRDYNWIISALFPGTHTTVLDNEESSFTQEFRLVSDFDGPLNFAAGVYYQDAESITRGLISSPEFIAGDNTRDFRSEQYSGFVEFTYEATDRLRLIAGTRYVEETIDARFPTNFGLGGQNLNPVLVERNIPPVSTFKLERFLPRAAVEYDFLEDSLLYASVASGARNGGVNATISPLQLATNGFVDPINEEIFLQFLTFDEDDVLSYEAGVKSTFLDGRLQVNLAGFYTDLNDPQVVVSVPFALAQNGPDQRIYGLEWETSWAVNDAVTFYHNGTYLNGRLEENQLLAPLSFAATVQGNEFDAREGNDSVNSPAFTLSTGVNVEFPIPGKDAVFTGALGHQFVDNRYPSVDNFASSKLPELHLLNARAGIAGDWWEAQLFVDNLANNVQFQLLDPLAGFAQILPNGELDATLDRGYINRPRTVGLEVTLRY